MLDKYTLVILRPCRLGIDASLTIVEEHSFGDRLNYVKTRTVFRNLLKQRDHAVAGP
jgi:hypothetical protein